MMIRKIILISFFLLIASFTTILNYTFFNSMKHQSALMYEYNANQFTLPLFIFDNFNNEIPNITQTTIPIKFLKARYLYKLDSLSEALNLLHQARQDNPYILAPEAMIANIYLDLEIMDSARFYSKKAYYTIPNNNVHRDVYFNVLKADNDSIELKKAFELIKGTNNINHWLDYLLKMYSVVGSNNKDLIKTSEEFPIEILKNKNQIEQLDYVKRLIKVGGVDITVSAELALEAENKFEEKEYELAGFLYQKASEFDPFEYSYLESAAISFNLAGNQKLAEQYFNKVISEFKPNNGKTEFYFGVMLMKQDRVDEACLNLKKASEYNYGNGSARDFYNQYCN